ncbi:protocadherin gamma-B2-like [Trichosurus vulpecula]|uniref:protocadherin gamma-B2-like n=1 Tax=Trichosurus vulpecula TaxID=9337 RepID=UPI00186B3AA3|nr:protocadherin gamma-B2-like [Trichosurus vulpecula]
MGRAGQRALTLRLQVLVPFLVSLFGCAFSEQILYSIPEETEKGSVVGNLAKDLGLQVRDLPVRKLRVSADREYFSISSETGELRVNGRIDREEICGRKPVCSLDFETVAENPLNIFHVTVVVLDINDNAPLFKRSYADLKISESIQVGSSFPLDPAVDSDVGINSLQTYYLEQNSYFDLTVKQSPDGNKYPELILKKSLDREQQSSHQLVLIALDGGQPARNGTVQIRVNVVDANDNAPVFSQQVYRVSMRENLAPGSSVLRVTATDQDEGINAEITFSFQNVDEDVKFLFYLHQKTGEITTKDILDFEIANSYTLNIEAKDFGDLASHCKIHVEILDENDCAPEMTLASVFSPVPENSEPGTVIALLKIRDRDSGENGKVMCYLQGNIPFKLESPSRNYYKLLTDGSLDREQTSEYNITVTATDKGNPPLSTSKTFLLFIGDVNDNAPVFLQTSYVAYVPENNPSGTSISCVSAVDSDLEQNGRVSYSIISSDLPTLPLSSYVSVNGHKGDIFAQRSFDYEQVRSFELILQACDGGSPALSANVSVRVFIVDQNDNAPIILYPTLGAEGLALFDMVPRSAKPGYLVTKVVAVDTDSGHNAWLAYHVLQATEPELFSLGLRTGEVRTTQALADKDVAKHCLLVSVQDGGQPPLSSTVTLHLVFADSLQEAMPKMMEESSEIPDAQSELQFYLVVALALISVLFLTTVTLAIALRLGRSSNSPIFRCFSVDFCSKTGPVIPPNYSEGTLPYSYNLCVASQGGKMEYNFLKLTGEMLPPQDFLFNDASGILNKSNGELQVTSDTVTPSHVSFAIISSFFFVMSSLCASS